MKKVILIMIGFLVFFSHNAFSQNYLVLKNNTGKRIVVAYARYVNKSEGWISQGWFSVEPYKSTSVNLQNHRGDVFLYATNNDGRIWSKKEASFCVDNIAFRITHANEVNCSEKLDFFKIWFEKGINNFTFNP